jgi:L-ascorbate metabolism protein UlaG (beta-lactamase superfamily)
MTAGAALIAALFALLPSAPPEPKLTARFIGNMAFAISDGKTTLYTDFPYESGAFGYMSYDLASLPAPGSVCLITHGHLDHFDARLFEKMDAKVIAPPDLGATLPAGRVIPFAPKIAYADFTVEPVKTPHAKIDHYSYLVTWRGVRLYFTGDTESTDALLAQRNLDAAFVSPWLIREVAKQGARIDARKVVVYHHRADETVPAFQGRIVPKQGDTLTLEASRPGAAR